MEDLSNQISSNLNEQGQKIRGTTEKVKEVKGVLGSANKLLDRMLSR